MLKIIRHQTIHALWNQYKQQSPQMLQIANKIAKHHCGELPLDHFAVIDLPGPHTGIPVLSNLFKSLGFSERGQGYLPDKQNDFAWLAQADAATEPPACVLPQAVVADFRLDEMPGEVRKIIYHYSAQAPAETAPTLQRLLSLALTGDENAQQAFWRLFLTYFSGRDWPAPSTRDYQTVYEFNPLLAWVLVFGRKPNHFTLSVHLMETFANLPDFLNFVANEVGLALNDDGGLIKGGINDGIAQGGTVGTPHPVHLSDGSINIPGDFVEFVWRYSKLAQPKAWQDYFTGFLARNANYVIEALV